MPDVIILLAVHNGARYLPAQLSSIAAQQGVNWTLIASDDASTDASRTILHAFAQNHPVGRVRIIAGPGRGAGANFRHLLAAVTNHDAAIAFCDQDDVWLPGKLQRGVLALCTHHARPALYCSRTVICDETLTDHCLSPALRSPPGFRNALVQNIAAGNTQMLNPAAARLVCAANAEAGPVVVHDWWVYQMITAAGGAVIFDDAPGLYYRQHGANVIGANVGPMAQLYRLGRVLRGDYARWNRQNIASLAASRHRFTRENARVFDAFSAGITGRFSERLLGLARAGVYRQSYRSRITFWLAAMLGRV